MFKLVLEITITVLQFVPSLCAITTFFQVLSNRSVITIGSHGARKTPSHEKLIDPLKRPAHEQNISRDRIFLLLTKDTTEECIIC